MKRILCLCLLSISFIGCDNVDLIEEPKDISSLNKTHNSGFVSEEDSDYYQY